MAPSCPPIQETTQERRNRLARERYDKDPEKFREYVRARRKAAPEQGKCSVCVTKWAEVGYKTCSKCGRRS